MKGLRLAARVAWRNLWRHGQRTRITVASIGLGLTLVIVVASLMTGVYGHMIDQAVRMQAGHVTLQAPGYHDAPAVDLRVAHVRELRRSIAALPAVEATKLLVIGQGVARSGSDAVGVAVMGIEPSVEGPISPIARHVVAGTWLDDGDGAWVMIGSQLARRLKIEPGKKLVLSTNDAEGNLVDGLFRVRGIFTTGSPETDGHMMQAPLAAIRKLYGLGADEATEIGVVLRDAAEEASVLRRIRAQIAGEPVVALPWQEVLPELLAGIMLDGVTGVTMVGILLVVVLFTIFNTILMSVLDRERESAVLLALGTPPAHLRLQVLLESAFVGVLGCGLGLVVGLPVAVWLQVRGIDLSGFGGLTFSGFAISPQVHARVALPAIAGLTGLVFAATMLVSLALVRRSARVPVVEILRGGLQ